MNRGHEPRMLPLHHTHNCVPPTGFEPISSDYKTDILPIELRRTSKK